MTDVHINVALHRSPSTYSGRVPVSAIMFPIAKILATVRECRSGKPPAPASCCLR